MRSVSTTLKKKLASRIQAGENALSASLWVARPTTPLTEDRFLEKQSVLSSNNITKTSIAVCHPRLMRGATEVYIGYLESGVIKVAKTNYVEEMERHQWIQDIGYSQEADDFCLCFDGTMPKAPNGRVEFKTEQLPWVFWVLDGVLYGRKIWDESEPFVLAESNCSAVSAIRAMWSVSGDFDFGLVVFFLLQGQLYYRQLIDGEWMDAEIVSFGPNGVSWSEIAAFRTWDYRIGIQGKTTDGVCYEMFTQFMGIGKQNTEHINVNTIPRANLTEIDYTDVTSRENINVKTIPTANILYALSSIPIEAYNVADNEGNYGTKVIITFDYPLSNVNANPSSFTMLDVDGVSYTCYESIISDDGLTATLTFSDFNLSEGKELTVTYTPGTIMCPVAPLDKFDISFIPVGLIAPNIPIPEPVEAWNLDSEGKQIAIRFSESLIGDVSGFEPKPVGYKQQAIDLSNAVVTTLNHYSTSYSGAKAIDGDTSTYWRGTTTVNWIAFQLNEAKALTGLRLITAVYYIKTFTVSGSNDGSNWIQIGDVQTVLNPSSSVWNAFTFDNDVEYLHYRIDVLTGSSRIYLYEIELLENVAVGNETKIVAHSMMYNYVPGGTLYKESRTPIAVEADTNDDHVVIVSFQDGCTRNLQNSVGGITLEYAGGSFAGKGGPVDDFAFEFEPVGLKPKNNPNADEHIEANIAPNAKLTRIKYTDVSNGNENVKVNVTPTATLIHVDDI